MLKCKWCGAAVVRNDQWATGDWEIEYACGTEIDDNEDVFRGAKCVAAEAAGKNEVEG